MQPILSGICGTAWHSNRQPAFGEVEPADDVVAEFFFSYYIFPDNPYISYPVCHILGNVIITQK